MLTHPRSPARRSRTWPLVLLAAVAGIVAPLTAHRLAATLTAPAPDPPRAWVLVVIIGADGEYEVWPGATDWLLGRRSQSFPTLAGCDTARRQLLARAAEPVTYRLEGGQVRALDAATAIRRAACLSVSEAS